MATKNNQQRCPRCKNWEDEEIDEGVEFSEASSWVALSILVAVIVGTWELLKAVF